MINKASFMIIIINNNIIIAYAFVFVLVALTALGNSCYCNLHSYHCARVLVHALVVPED
jgi:hypothetical protein